MNKQSLNWLEISKKYKGLWVALNADETQVISASEDAGKAYKEAQDNGVKIPILFRAPEEAMNYIGCL